MKKVGTIKGVPVIEGDPNEIKQGQLHYEDKGGGNIALSKRDSNNELKQISGEQTGKGEIEYEYYCAMKDGNYTTLPEVFERMYAPGIIPITEVLGSYKDPQDIRRYGVACNTSVIGDYFDMYACKIPKIPNKGRYFMGGNDITIEWHYGGLVDIFVSYMSALDPSIPTPTPEQIENEILGSCRCTKEEYEACKQYVLNKPVGH